MTEEQISNALYNVLDSYEFELSFKPGLKTLCKIAGAAVVGNLIGFLLMGYMSEKMHQTAEKIDKVTDKLKDSSKEESNV